MKNALVCNATPAEGERLEIMLTELGFAQILASGDTDRALSLALDCIADVAIIDITSSGKEWLQLLTAIRKRMQIPVILLGGNFNIDSIETAIAAGAGGFLVKPVRKEELWSAIEVASVYINKMEELKEKVSALEGALENRKVVDRAKGVLISRQGLSEPDAFRRMQKLAMDKRTTLVKIAEAILLTEDGSRREVAAR